MKPSANWYDKQTASARLAEVLMKRNQQANIFTETPADLPLFSATPYGPTPDSFTPAEVAQPLSIFDRREYIAPPAKPAAKHSDDMGDYELLNATHLGDGCNPPDEEEPEPALDPHDLTAIYVRQYCTRNNLVWSLSGQSARHRRQHLMQLMTGVKMPLAKCGTFAVEAELYKYFGPITGDCDARRERNLSAIIWGEAEE